MILHIFKKDIRRLWPAIALSLAALGALTWHDRWRSDRAVGEIEGYLNLLVPLAWACLLALAVEQEPLVGDRVFWITRPYRRRDVLAAKLLFAALFVHLPMLLSDCWILQTRGFPPLLYTGELLAKQLATACALTLPAMALAALVRNFSHFVLELVAVTAAVLVVAGAIWTPQTIWEVFETVRRQLALVLAAAGAIAVLGLQYLGRRVAWSRGVAVAAGGSAILLFTLFVPHSALAIRSAFAPAPEPLTMRIGDAPRAWPARWGRGYPVAIPIVLSGVPAETQARLTMLSSQIVAGGQTFESNLRTVFRPYDRLPYYAGFLTENPWEDAAPQWFVLSPHPSILGKLRSGSVTITGEMGVTLTHSGQPVWMGTAETRDFGELGRCASSIAERAFADASIKLECESPRHNPTGMRVRLWSPETGREWKHWIGEARPYMTGLRLSWLSPLHRDVVYLQASPDPKGMGSEWLVPERLIPAARFEITRMEPAGYGSIRFEFRDLDLQKFNVRQP